MVEKVKRLILYHRTTSEAAAAILTEGFRDMTGFYMMSKPITGVWVSDEPLDPQEGPKREVLLEIRLAMRTVQIRRYEVIEKRKTYREWCIPAQVLNKKGAFRVLTSEEEEEIPTRIDSIFLAEIQDRRKGVPLRLKRRKGRNS